MGTPVMSPPSHSRRTASGSCQALMTTQSGSRMRVILKPLGLPRVLLPPVISPPLDLWTAQNWLMAGSWVRTQDCYSGSPLGTGRVCSGPGTQWSLRMDWRNLISGSSYMAHLGSNVMRLGNSSNISLRANSHLRSKSLRFIICASCNSCVPAACKFVYPRDPP
jgi:hypothetical protein